MPVLLFQALAYSRQVKDGLIFLVTGLCLSRTMIA